MVAVPRIGRAQRSGTREWCCDGMFVYRYDPDAVTAACVMDAPGSSERISRTVRTMAEVAARMGARRSVFAGLSAAAELVAFPQTEEDASSDAVAVLAAWWEDSVSVAWVGDCRAWTWDGQDLAQATADQTMLRWLAEVGTGHTGATIDVPDDLADFTNSYVRVSLATASAATIREVHFPAPAAVILTSDGVHDALGAERMAELVRRYAADPQGLAEALVAAPEVGEDGYRDDATAVVLAPPV